MSKRSPVVLPLVLAALVAVGFGMVWSLLVFWADEIVAEYVWSRQAGTQRSVAVAANGTPLLGTYSVWERHEIYHTLEGKEIVVPLRDHVPVLEGASLQGPSRSSSSQSIPWTRRIVEFAVPLRPPLRWYFVHDGRPDGSGYFVAYDPKTKLCAGYFGSKGFRSERPPADEWLPVDGRLMLDLTAFNGLHGGYKGVNSQERRDGADPEIPPWRNYLISGSRLLEIDLKGHSVRPVLEANDLMAVNLVEQAAEASAPLVPRTPSELRTYVALRTPDRVLVIHPSRAERRTYLLPEEVRRRAFEFYELNNQRVLLIDYHATFGERTYRLLWIDPAGKVIRREDVLGFEGTTWDKATTRTWVDAAAMSAPVALAALFATELAAGFRGPGEEMSASEAVAAAFSVGWPALAAVVVLSAGLTILVWRRQRRYATAGTLLWMGFVLLGGVPGLLAYRFHRRWPVLEACPACGELVPRDRDACAECGAEFPAPAPKGTEVFAA